MKRKQIEPNQKKGPVKKAKRDQPEEDPDVEEFSEPDSEEYNIIPDGNFVSIQDKNLVSIHQQIWRHINKKEINLSNNKKKRLRTIIIKTKMKMTTIRNNRMRMMNKDRKKIIKMANKIVKEMNKVCLVMRKTNRTKMMQKKKNNPPKNEE